MRVIQYGRFPNDEQFWMAHLSTKVGERNDGYELGFTLQQKSDFQFFDKTMKNDLASLQWSASQKLEDGSDENEESD